LCSVAGVRAAIVVAEDASQFDQIIELSNRWVYFTFMTNSSTEKHIARQKTAYAEHLHTHIHIIRDVTDVTDSESDGIRHFS